MSLSRTQTSRLKKFFKSRPEIKVVYLFGSQATGQASALSDFDFAVYLDPKFKDNAFDMLIELSGRIPLLIGTDRVDVVIINSIDNLILKNSIISQGIVLYEVPGYRLDLEISIAGEYRDFRILERQYYPD